MKPVLDACCGARMFWFDKDDDRAVFSDRRRESHTLKRKEKTSLLEVRPDLIADFTNLPFPDENFRLVVFDPPHLDNCGTTGWVGKKYGFLEAGWEDEIAKGFAECFRVLRPWGTLVFKWNECRIPVSRVLALTNQRPLVGNQCGKKSKTHWMVFLKEGE